MKGVVKRESKGQRIFSSRDTDIIRGDWSPSLPRGKKSDSAESINEPAVYTALMSRLNIEPFTSSERTPRGRGAAGRVCASGRRWHDAASGPGCCAIPEYSQGANEAYRRTSRQGKGEEEIEVAGRPRAIIGLRKSKRRGKGLRGAGQKRNRSMGTYQIDEQKHKRNWCRGNGLPLYSGT